MSIYTNINGVWQETPLMTGYELDSPNYGRDDVTGNRDLNMRSIVVSPHIKVDGVWHPIKQYSESDITRMILYIFPTWVTNSSHRAWKTTDDIGVYINGNQVTFDFKLVNEQTHDWTYMAGRSMIVLFEDRFGDLWCLDFFHSRLHDGSSLINYYPEGESFHIFVSNDHDEVLRRIGRPIRVGKFVPGIWFDMRRHYIYSGSGYSNWYERLFFKSGGNTAQYEDYRSGFDFVSKTATESVNANYTDYAFIAGKKTSHDTNFRCEFSIYNLNMNGRRDIPVTFIDLGDFRDYNPSN